MFFQTSLLLMNQQFLFIYLFLFIFMFVSNQTFKLERIITILYLSVKVKYMCVSEKKNEEKVSLPVKYLE